MVGRAGRSKGCLSCRKRRIKCDEKKPICQRCSAADFTCAWPEVSFIATNQKASGLVTATSHKQSLRTTDRPQPLLLTSAQLSLSDDVFLCYLQSTLFVSSDSLSTRTPTWPGFLAQPPTHPLASKSLLSLSKAYYGRQHSLPRVTMLGRELYGSSLKTLNDTLSSFRVDVSDDTLLAVMILGLYELLVLNSNRGWIEHALALGQMLLLRGPRSHDNMQELVLFESNRFIVILASLAASVSTFLSDAKWKTLPWANDPDSKDELQRLLDIFADLATLKAASFHSTTMIEKSKICLQVEQAIAALLSWRTDWDFLNVMNISQIDQPNLADKDVLPAVYTFTSLRVANTQCLYDAALIQAIRIYSNLTNESTPTHNYMLQEAAREICMSTDYQMVISPGMNAQFHLLFPLRMASLALDHSDSPFKDWILRKLELFAGAGSSWGVARRLSEYGGHPCA